MARIMAPTTQVAAGSAAPAAAELSRFFNRLVELIPAKFYRPDEEERMDLQHMKKADRMVVKQQFKIKAKQNKLAKLATSSSSHAAAAAEAAERAEALHEAVPSTSAAGRSDTKHGASLLNIPDDNLPRDKLQEKLQQRLLVSGDGAVPWAGRLPWGRRRKLGAQVGARRGKETGRWLVAVTRVG